MSVFMAKIAARDDRGPPPSLVADPSGRGAVALDAHPGQRFAAGPVTVQRAIATWWPRDSSRPAPAQATTSPCRRAVKQADFGWQTTASARRAPMRTPSGTTCARLPETIAMHGGTRTRTDSDAEVLGVPAKVMPARTSLQRPAVAGISELRACSSVN